MIHGTKDLELGAYGCGTQTSVLYGLFGGYPGSPSRTSVALGTDLKERLSKGEVPSSWSELSQGSNQKIDLNSNHPAFPIQEYDVVYNRWLGGAGYGDPLERDPERVLLDVSLGAFSQETAMSAFGVSIVDDALDLEGTKSLRDEIYKERREQGQHLFLPEGAETPRPKIPNPSDLPSWRLQEYLDIVQPKDNDLEVCCRTCQTSLGPAIENYKRYALVRRRQPAEYLPLRHKSGDFNEYWEYYCPGCTTQIAVDVMDPSDPEPIWDTQLDLSWFERQATVSNQDNP